MKTLIEKAIQNRVAANLFALLIIVIGILMASTLNVRLFPSVTLYSISITVPYPGATPQEVEDAIVRPIEDRLNGLEGITKITALSASGVASVIVDISESESIPEMLDDIQTEIDRITVFPQRAEEPQIVHAETLELSARVLLYGDVSPSTLKKAAEQIRSNLTDKEGISRVDIGGVPPYLIDIAVSANMTQAIGLSLPQIADRIAGESQDLSGGEIENNAQRILIRSVGERRSGSELEDVVIASSQTGTPVFLNDIAQIDDGLSETPIASRFQGKSAVFLSIQRVGDESTINIVDILKSYMETEMDAVLPQGVQAYFWRDESSNLQDRIDLLGENAIIGLLLVLILLMAFLEIRIAMWVAFGVSVAFLGSFSLMGIFNVSINQLSLFGFILAIGIVVDDAIVVGENMHGTWRKLGGSPQNAVLQSTLRVSTPILFSVSTTIVAFLPLLILPGTFGQFMSSIASVVIFVLLFSLFDSFFILPHHLGHLRNNKPRKFSPRRIADIFRNWFSSRLRRFTDTHIRKMVTFAVRNPLAIIMVTFGIFFSTLTLLSSGAVKTQAFPEVTGDFLTANLVMSESTSQAETQRQAQRIAEGAIRASKRFDAENKPAMDGVLWAMGGGLGQGEPEAIPDGGAAANEVQIVARLLKASERTFAAEDFVDVWRAEVGKIPGAETFTFAVDLVSSGAPIQLEVSTQNSRDTHKAVNTISEALASVEGVYDVSDDRFRTTDEIRVSIKPLARSYGITQNELARQVRSAFFGAEATRIQRDREEIQVRVRLPESERQSLETLKTLRVRVGDGFIPITQLADISIEPAPSTITRIGGRRINTIQAYVQNSIITADEANNYVLNTLVPELSKEYSGLGVSLAGAQEEFGKTAPALARNFAIALMLIYTLLAMNFKSYTQPIIVMIAIPFGFSGALLGHWMLGMNLSLLSFFGIIGLSGVIINNSLMVVNFLNERLENGEDPQTAVIEAVLDRFRAILLTTLTTFLGVTPIILETSLQAQFLVPTATSLGFGILVGSSLLMFCLPALAALHLKWFGAKKFPVLTQLLAE